MNRRNFFTKLGMAATSLAILPSAMTYARRWIKTETIWTPAAVLEDADWEIFYYDYGGSGLSSIIPGFDIVPTEAFRLGNGVWTPKGSEVKIA